MIEDIKEALNCQCKWFTSMTVVHIRLILKSLLPWGIKHFYTQ